MRIHQDHDFVMHYLHELELSKRLKQFVTIFQNSNGFLDLQNNITTFKTGSVGSYPLIEENYLLNKEAKLFDAALKLINRYNFPKKYKRFIC